MQHTIFYAKVGAIKRDLNEPTKEAAQAALEAANDAELFDGLADFLLPATGLAPDIEVFDEAPRAYAVESDAGDYVCFEDPLKDFRCGEEPSGFKEALASAQAIRVGGGALLEEWELGGDWADDWLEAVESDADGNLIEHAVCIEKARKIGAFTWQMADGTLVDLYRFMPVRVGGAG